MSNECSRRYFLILLFLLAAQRLWELRLSRRNASALLQAGGREHAAGQVAIMKVLHAAWFVTMVGEVFWLRRPFRPWVAAVAGGVFLAGQTLRYVAIHALGPRWTVRVITLPGAAPVTEGIYGSLRHPNYVGVALELAAVPLLHSAYGTALLFSLANALLLRARIRVEEGALAADNDYLRFKVTSSGHLPAGLRQPKGTNGGAS